MRICYFADGRYVHAERWMKFFADRGHKMHLISFAEIPPQQVNKFEKIGITYHGSTGNVHLKKFWLTLKDVRFVKSVLAEEKIDILHSHFLGNNAWFAYLSGFHPHILTIMGGDVIGADWKPKSNIQDKLLTPLSLKKADAVTAWSRFLADVVRPFCGEDASVDVVHGGIHLESFFPGPKPRTLLDKLQIPHDAKVIFSPRLMRPLYNILEIAKSADIVAKAIHNVYYLIASPLTIADQDYAARVRAEFESGAARENVRFISEITHNEIADYFRLADLTVSIASTDGTPMTVLESMACGTPTVIGNLPDYDREYFEHEKTTLMVDVKNPQSVTDAIFRLLSDDDLRCRITAEARRRVLATGGYEYQMSKMEDIYRRVLAQ